MRVLAALLCLAPLFAQAPPNAAATVQFDGAHLRLVYQDRVLLEAALQTGDDHHAAKPGEVTLEQTGDPAPKVEQRLRLRGRNLRLVGTVTTSSEGLAAELRGAAQQRFPMLRMSAGRSDNRRNHAVYDRRFDWLLAGPDDGHTVITPADHDRWQFSSEGSDLTLTFRPRFYQQHKQLTWFEPWTYQVYRGSVTGWCSWWAYRDGFDQQQLEGLVAALSRQHLADFGYRWIQIDDCYQTSMGMPAGWLQWNEKFPKGAAGAVAAIRSGGFEPGIWVYSAFHDQAVVQQHPDWFVQRDGQPFEGPWVGHGLDGSNDAALDAVVRPTQQGFKALGFTYVKVDSLRHLLYDSYHHALPYLAQEGTDPAQAFRSYLRAAREGMQPGAFLLACWGVLPEAIGLADGCRLGTDGFGPACLQQYNSWNGIVWRNDPDHCDVLPKWRELQDGVLSERAAAMARRDAVLRPSLVSIGGGVLMLSDRAEVYGGDVEGLKRTAPVLFSVPGQLYDFDPQKSDRLASMARTDILTGSGPSPVDADQGGAVCPWWLLEVEQAGERWDVLAHFAAGDQDLPAQRVEFRDLGIGDERLVYEFWSQRCLGLCRGGFVAEALPAHGTQVFALRRPLPHPQILSTSRHITQGGVDLLNVAWDGERLAGRSRVVGGDRYELVLHVPAGFTAQGARMDGKACEVTQDGEVARVAITPQGNGDIDWDVQCRRVP